MKEFVAAKIAIEIPNTTNTLTETNVTPTDTTSDEPPSPSSEIINTSNGIPSSPSTTATTPVIGETDLASSTPTSPPQEVSNPTETPFTLVRNGARNSGRRVRHFMPKTMANRFQVLAEQENDISETRIVGDSIIRAQLPEFCGRAPQTRKRLCLPGATIEEISARCEEATSCATDITQYIIHLGTNDIKSTRSEELMGKYRKLIWTFINKTRNITLSGILPCIGAEDPFYSKAYSTNSRLCKEKRIDYINFWDSFYNKDFLYNKDGLHLNKVGAARLGRLLNDHIKAKNAALANPDDSR